MVNGWQKIPWIFDLAVVLESLSIGMPVFGYQDSEVFFNWHPHLNESKWTYLFCIYIYWLTRYWDLQQTSTNKACATLSFGQAIATTSQVSRCPLPLTRKAKRLQPNKTDNFLRPRPVHKIGGPATAHQSYDIPLDSASISLDSHPKWANLPVIHHSYDSKWLTRVYSFTLLFVTLFFSLRSQELLH